MIKNPCFNEETATDCPRRCVGCGATCPEWLKYTEEREKEYEKRLVRAQVNSIVSATGFRRAIKSQKDMLRMKRIKR